MCLEHCPDRVRSDDDVYAFPRWLGVLEAGMGFADELFHLWEVADGESAGVLFIVKGTANLDGFVGLLTLRHVSLSSPEGGHGY